MGSDFITDGICCGGSCRQGGLRRSIYEGLYADGVDKVRDVLHGHSSAAGKAVDVDAPCRGVLLTGKDQTGTLRKTILAMVRRKSRWRRSQAALLTGIRV